MIGALHDDLVTWLGVHLDRQLIGHGARGHEQRRLFPQHLRRHLLQTIDTGIFAKDIIPHFRFRHGPAHARRGLGDCITA